MKKLVKLIFLLTFTCVSFSQTCKYTIDQNDNVGHTNINCSYIFENSCIALKANFPTILNSNSYQQPQLISYTKIGNFNEGTPIFANDDDRFIKRINFNQLGSKPFLFHFFGEIKESVIISSNGLLSFNNDLNEGDYNSADLNNHQIPNNALPQDAIFGLFQDLDFSPSESEIYYQLIGEYPCRKLVVNFNKARLLNTDDTTNFQVVLHEQTGIININIENKPFPKSSMRLKQSTIGIQGKNNSGYAPANRNTGIWSANQESYFFIPNGDVLIPQQYNWTNNLNGNQQNTQNINVCQITPSIYTAKATYINQNNQRFSISSDHVVNVDSEFPIAKNHTEYICNSSTNLTQNYFYNKINSQPNYLDFIYKFYLDINDAINGNSNFITTNLQLNTTYFVRIENKNNSNCHQISKLDITNTIDFPTEIEVCDTDRDNSIDQFDLNTLACKIFPDLTNVTNIRYYINNTLTTQTSLANNSILKVEFDMPGCENIMSEDIRIRFKNGPNLVADEIDFISMDEIFDVVSDINPLDREPFNWLEEFRNRDIQFAQNLDDVASIYAYENMDDLILNRFHLLDLKNGKPDLNYTYPIYLRINRNENDCTGNCYSILKVNAKVKFKQLILNISDADFDNPTDDPSRHDEEIANIYICDTETTVERNLYNDAKSVMKVMNPNLSFDDLKISFYTNFDDARNHLNNGIDRNITLSNTTNNNFLVKLTIDDEFAESETAKYIIARLQYNLIQVEPITSKIDICVEKQINQKEIILTDYIQTIFSQTILDLNPEIKFYLNENDQESILSTMVQKEPKTIWVKIKFDLTETLCENYFPLQIQLISNENIITNTKQIEINCDHNNDQREEINLNDYLNYFVENVNLNNYKFYKNYNREQNILEDEIQNPTQYELTSSTTIFIKVYNENSVSSCEQILELNLNFLTTSQQQIELNEEANLLMCNLAQQEIVYFNLEKSISQLYTEANSNTGNSFITSIKYYENYEDAKVNASNNITDFTHYPLAVTSPTKTVYVRFESVNGCYSIAPINLTIIGIIKLKNNLEATICDEDLDGIYRFNFRNWINERINDDNYANDLLTDYVANRLSNYKIYLNEANYQNGISLTEEEEQNFILDPNLHPYFILEASLDGGCFDTIKVNINYTRSSIHNFTITPICDDLNDGIEAIDLTQFETEFENYSFKYYRSLEELNTGINKIENPSNYNFNQLNGDKIYFKIINQNQSCSSLGIIDIRLIQVPMIEIEDFFTCKGETILIAPDYYNYAIQSYKWMNQEGEIISTNPTIEINEIGNYSLEITTTEGCTYVEEFAFHHYSLPIIEQIIFQKNNATLIVNSPKTILYSLDGITWQTSNTFENLEAGLHHFYVKYLNEDCISGPFDGLIPIIINTITPNGDGINDKWSIKNLDVFNGKSSRLEIYDRYGKLIYSQESNTELWWDGKDNGKPLPSTSYWYTIYFADDRKFNGYINIINKN